MAFSQLDFGLSQAGAGSGHQKIPSKKKPINQSLPHGATSNNPNTSASSQPQYVTSVTVPQHSNLTYASTGPRSQHESLNKPGMGPHKKHAVYSPDRAAAANSSMNHRQGGNAMLFHQGGAATAQYATQGGAPQPGLQKVQQIQANPKQQQMGKSPYQHKMYNTSQPQTQSVQRGKVIQMQQQQKVPQQVVGGLRSHTTASNALS